MIIERFPYSKIQKKNVDGRRLYDTESGFLPSVTTILEKTKPQEAIDSLNQWRNRIGHDEAKRITNEAANVGTLMHKFLEDWVKTDAFEAGKNMSNLVAKRMANTVIDNIKDDLNEVWGTEISLYYSSLFAGTADLVGVWKGQPTICDFKQTNKPKKREWITDYFLQGCLYAEAHNFLFGTNIKSVAIFMCSRDCEFQLFEIVDKEFDHYAAIAASRVAQYHGI